MLLRFNFHAMMTVWMFILGNLMQTYVPPAVFAFQFEEPLVPPCCIYGVRVLRVICITSDTSSELLRRSQRREFIGLCASTWLASKRNANKSHPSLVAIIVFPSPNKNGRKTKMQRRPTGCSFYYFCVDVRV
jgi:hypothetical protein